MTKTPRRLETGVITTVTAASNLHGPSAEMAVSGLRVPTTTGSPQFDRCVEEERRLVENICAVSDNGTCLCVIATDDFIDLLS
jgi:hypothetical protein